MAGGAVFHKLALPRSAGPLRSLMNNCDTDISLLSRAVRAASSSVQCSRRQTTKANCLRSSIPDNRWILGWDILEACTEHGAAQQASPSYGVCQTTEKRVSGLSSFVEQRSCHFFWVKGMLRVWIALVNVSSWSSLRVFSSYLTGGRACWCSPCLSDSWGGRAFTDVSLVGFDPV